MAEMVLEIDLAYQLIIYAQTEYSPGSLDGLRNELNGQVTRGNDMVECFEKKFGCEKHDINTDYDYD